MESAVIVVFQSGYTQYRCILYNCYLFTPQGLVAYILVVIIVCQVPHEQDGLKWSEYIFIKGVIILKKHVVSFFYLETLKQSSPAIFYPSVCMHLQCNTIVYMYASRSGTLMKARCTWYMRLSYFSMCNITQIEMVYAIRLSLYEYLTSQLLIYMLYFMPKPRHCITMFPYLRLYKPNRNCINCHKYVSIGPFPIIVPDFWDWRIALPSINRCLPRHLVSLKHYMLNHCEYYCWRQCKVIGRLIHCHTIRLIYVLQVKHNLIITLLCFGMGTIYYHCNNSTRLVFNLAQNSMMPNGLPQAYVCCRQSNSKLHICHP